MKSCLFLALLSCLAFPAQAGAVAACVPSRDGDLNGDGRVDAEDVRLIQSRLRQRGAYDARFDTNCDGTIDEFDLVFVTSQLPENLDNPARLALPSPNMVPPAAPKALAAAAPACLPAADPDITNDGIVSLADLTLVTRNFGLGPADARLDRRADTNCDGAVDKTDVVYVQKAMGKKYPIAPKVDFLMEAAHEIQIHPGQRANMGLHASIQSNDAQPFTLVLTQTASPAAGLAFSPPVAGQAFIYSASGYPGFDETVEALAPGDYTVTTTATVVETGVSRSAATRVQVVPTDRPLVTLHLWLSEIVLPPNVQKQVEASVSIGGDDYQTVQAARLYQLDGGPVLALGKTGPATYEGALSVDTAGLVPDDCRSFVAEMDTPKGSLRSEPSKICVTGFPTTWDTPTPKHTVTASNGVMIGLDYLLVRFKKDVTEARIREILAAVGGEVIGVSGHKYLFQIAFPNDPYEAQVLNLKQSLLKQYPEVESVNYNMAIGQPLSINPNDSLLINGEQREPYISRADEAWFVARGAEPIAILDTGVDYGHPDLASKILPNGVNLAKDGELSAQDKHGHGSHRGLSASAANVALPLLTQPILPFSRSYPSAKGLGL